MEIKSEFLAVLMFPLVVINTTILAQPGLGDHCEDRLSNCDAFDPSDCKTFPQWGDVNCRKTCRYCQPCPEGWSHYKPDNTCLKLFGQDKLGTKHTWEYASLKCKNIVKDGDLVEIRGPQKTFFVMNLIRNSRMYVWIGLKNVATTGHFKFVYMDGSPLKDTYHPWTKGNPDDFEGKEKCVQIFPTGPNVGRWNDYDCHYMLPYVCERPDYNY